MLVVNETEFDSLGQPLALFRDDGEFARSALFLDPETRVPHDVNVTWNP